MELNRSALSLLLTMLILSILVCTVRSCSDAQSKKYGDADRASDVLKRECYRLTKPIKDYRIREIAYGAMIVDAGPSLTSEQVKTLAGKLTMELHDREHESLGSDLVMVDIRRGGSTICQAQTSAQGLWVKLK